ncbi:DUF309 domain-containing protein [Chroococcus sp. FPU101]|uniref:DUF309 domain-containing protein n=1 Tax=Chroococcus sp. FPU101 TaxID=1974212 RepID=UPI001A8E44EF|nr:DUF309 domain-containing protein [Chroococcus sp. FPU101]GFE67683.1 hypothetical protein CFPU101_02930 [Chroococcus sp. FPU101]
MQESFDSVPQAFWQGVDEFNQHEFYACHDTLEALWMEAPEPNKRFYQGVLQIAVGCYHLGNHNGRGAMILLGEGIKRLKDYLPIYEEIDVTQLLEESSELLSLVQQTDPNELTFLVQQLDENVFSWPRIISIEQNV